MPGPPLVQGSCGPVRESFTETLKSILKGFDLFIYFFIIIFSVAAFTECFVLFIFFSSCPYWTLQKYQIHHDCTLPFLLAIAHQYHQ